MALTTDIAFNGSIQELTGGTETIAQFGNGTTSFSSDSNGSYLEWSSALSPGKGLTLSTGELTNREVYSIAMRFSLGSIGQYSKLIDFKNRTTDNGFYLTRTSVSPNKGKLDVYISGSNIQGPEFQAGDLIDIIATRASNGEFKVYMNSGSSYINVLTYQDTANTSGATVPALVNNAALFGFLFDDAQVNQSEFAPSGKLYAIKLYDSVLTPSEVSTVFPTAPAITSATYDATAGVLAVTGTNLVATGGSNNDIDVSKLTLTAEGGTAYTLTSSNVEITNATSFSVTLNATDQAALNQILNKNGTSSTGGTTYNLAAAANWNPATTGAADLTGNGITVSNVPVPAITSATYDLATGALVVTGTGFLKLNGATNDIDVSKLTITGQGGSTRTLTSTSVEITSGTSFSVTLNSADQTALQSLLNQTGTSSSGGTIYNLAAAEDWAAGADAAVFIADLTVNSITVSNYTTSSGGGGGSSGGGGGTASASPTAAVTQPSPKIDTTPIDPAPAGTNIQPTDADGDGLREVITAVDGAMVDGNRDGIPDVTQTEVAGLRLINDGAKGSDYGAIVINPGVQLRDVTLAAPSSDGSIPVTLLGGSTIATTIPVGIVNSFAGVVSFNVSGVTPGGTTQGTIAFPSGLPGDSGNAYVRFNYSTNRFEEFVDAAGNPLYSFVDSNGDGIFDAVQLTLIDADPSWDGDGAANGTVMDPGFLAIGERVLEGTQRRDTLIGNVLANTLTGKKNRDWLQGDLGNDILKGGHNNDHIYGGEGADEITGGKDKDRFIYTTVVDSPTALRDSVKFGTKDRFVFSTFDGDSTTEGLQKLSFIGKKLFSGVAGELRATRSVLEADVDGDSLADFAVNLRGHTLITDSNLVL